MHMRLLHLKTSRVKLRVWDEIPSRYWPIFVNTRFDFGISCKLNCFYAAISMIHCSGGIHVGLTHWNKPQWGVLTPANACVCGYITVRYLYRFHHHAPEVHLAKFDADCALTSVPHSSFCRLENTSFVQFKMQCM